MTKHVTPAAAEVGSEKLTAAEIAERLGISKATYYRRRKTDPLLGLSTADVVPLFPKAKKRRGGKKRKVSQVSHETPRETSHETSHETFHETRPTSPRVMPPDIELWQPAAPSIAPAIEPVSEPEPAPEPTSHSWLRRAGQLVIGLPMIAVALAVGALSMWANWQGVHSQIANPEWAAILGGLAVAAELLLLLMQTAVRFIERKTAGLIAGAYALFVVCFIATALSQAGGMLTALADGAITRENRETTASVELAKKGDHIQARINAMGCGDGYGNHKACNKLGAKLGDADDAATAERSKIQAAADPLATALAPFGLSQLQVHAARVLSLMCVSILMCVALTLGMELAFPRRD